MSVPLVPRDLPEMPGQPEQPEQAEVIGGSTPASEASGETRRQGIGRGLAELPVLLLIALVLAFLIKTFLLQAFYIPSGSMLDTLQINDRVLVEKVSYHLRGPERGEVIVFRRPGAPERSGLRATARSFFEGIGLVAPDQEIDLIKRVIGLPGDTIEITEGIVSVNGTALSEPYVLADQRTFPPTTVPEGEYYMLGDNRGNSDDSRYTLGTVPLENVVGRAFAIIWPVSSATLNLGHDLGPVEEAGSAPTATAQGARSPRAGLPAP